MSIPIMNQNNNTDPGEGAARALLAAPPAGRLLRGHGPPPGAQKRHGLRLHRLLAPRPRGPALVRASSESKEAHHHLPLTNLPIYAHRVVPFFLLGRQHVLTDHRKKITFGYPFHKGDVKWDESTSIRYPLLCSLAGLASGLFGIGGGMVKAPLLLEMGVLPTVQAATVATMILFTSGASTVSLIVLDLMPHDYGVMFFFFGMVATGIGAAAVRKVLMKHKKQSVIVLSVGLIISTSVVTMGIQSLLRLVADPKSILHFGSVCGAGTGE